MAESALIEELLRQYGENPRRVFARLANEYRKQGDLTTAIEICRTQVPLQPTYISGYIVLGQALFESGQLDEARATFEAAIGLDPENLIALRQLGDIARLSGDFDSARSWYYRLLEVDPQNVDVAVHLKVLETSPAAPAPTLGGGEPVSWSDINPERPGAPAPVFPPLPRLTLGTIPENLAAVPDPASAPPPPAVPPVPASPAASSTAPTLQIAGLEELAQFSAPIAPPPPIAPAPGGAVGSAAAPPPPLPDISAFAMPTPPTGTLATPAPPAAPAPPTAPAVPRRETTAGPPAVTPRVEPLHVEEEEPPLWSPPAPVGRPPEPFSPPAADSLRDTGHFPTPRAVPSTDAAAAAPAPAPASSEGSAPPGRADPRSGVDSWGSIPLGHGALSAPIGEPYDPTVGRMLDLNAGSSGDVPAAFMTETMAELYLQQGYHEEALRIYRQLAAARPDDPSLRERIARLEGGARSSISVAASVSEHVISAAKERASRQNQTIRNFFGGLASKRPPEEATPPSAMAAAPAAPAGPVAPVAPVVPAAPVAPVAPVIPAVPSARPVPTPPRATAAAAAPVAPAAPEIVRRISAPTNEQPPTFNGGAPGALAELFAERVPAADDAAAVALAGAFSEDFSRGQATPAAGQPARAAAQPLSLDDVFRDQRAPAEPSAAASNVSFDDFFSPRDGGSAPAVRSATPHRGAESTAGAPPEADLALFHEWLDGLKK